MNMRSRNRMLRTGFFATLLSMLNAGCGSGSQDPILGPDGVAARAPSVIAVTPQPDAVDVAVAAPGVTATFSEPMSPIAGAASFVLACEAPCADPGGTVTFDNTQTVATFNLTPGSTLNDLTQYTATITGATSLATGLPLDQPHSWRFTSGVAPDVARPQVTLTVPATTTPGPTGNVPVSTPITARFNEAMAPATISDTSMTITCASPCIAPAGSVSYDAATRTAVFVPSAALRPASTYTMTIKRSAADLAGNALAGDPARPDTASDYVWSFDTQTPPSVTAVTPSDGAASVAINSTVINAQFSEPVAPLTGAAGMTLDCAAPCSAPAGSISLDATQSIVSFGLPAGVGLEPSTLYSATVFGAVSVASGLTQQGIHTWQFTTGTTADTSRPRVILTDPVTTTPGPTPGMPANGSIVAVFNEDMAPASIGAASFTLSCAAPCTAPAGRVSYSVGGRSAIFAPDTALVVGSTYTATITTAATDLAGNGLAGNQAAAPAPSNYVWSFVVTTEPAAENISVRSVNPSSGIVCECPGTTLNAVFRVPSGLRIDPASVNSETFTLTGPGPDFTPVSAASIVLDASGLIASFTPAEDLALSFRYTATIKGGANGVRDLASPPNFLAEDYRWSFTIAPVAGHCPHAPPLASVAPFGVFGGSAGMTNQGIRSLINGDIGTTAASTAVTGFHDPGLGCVYTETGSNIGAVNGLIYTAAPPPTASCPSEGTAATSAVATQARADAVAAYDALAALEAGPDLGAGNLAGLNLIPGVYTAEAGSFVIQGGDLVLDAQGDINGVWVFQMAGSLTVGGPAATAPVKVVLANGAQAKNVFWQVGSSAIVNAAGGGTMAGTILSRAGATFSTAGNTTVLRFEGRALSLDASVTLVNTAINVPAP